MNKIMAQNSLNFRSEEGSYMDTLIMKLLKSSMEKENDDHDVFGAYVAMEMRNLKTSDAQKKLRGEIRDSISRIVCEESMTTIDHTKTSNSELKIIDNDLKIEDNLLKPNSSENHHNVDIVSQEKTKNSWELIN